MVIVRLYGGLGNQMFQYAVGRRLALDKKVRLWLDLTPFDLPWGTPRRFELGVFGLKSTVLPAWAAQALFEGDGRLKRPARWMRFDQVVENGLGYNPAIFDAAGNLYLDGYWQTEKYFASVANHIRSDFVLRSDMSARSKHILAEIERRPSISLHVRRADYVADPETAAYHGTCSPEYYADAMSRMMSAAPNHRFVVFGDDPAWAEANLPPHPDTLFTTPVPAGKDAEDMVLMSRCAHHIIANSSFSWWGAWLNPSLEKIVIAPQRWFLAETNMEDRFPCSWQVI